MRQEWNQVLITKVALAMHVKPGSGKAIHKDRPFHGFVISEEDDEKDYYFSDGQVLHTDGCSLFYLPKGSTYQVKAIQNRGCYAINFDADMGDVPFAVRLKNPERLRKRFRVAAEQWHKRSPWARACTMGALYDAIFQVGQELSEYATRQVRDKLQPALQLLEAGVTEAELSVAALAEACGVSQVYFRKVFRSCFGISPKEYMIQKRLEYARQLLESGQFSIREVAELCGYTEPCQFSRAFAKHTGVAPSRYEGE